MKELSNIALDLKFVTSARLSAELVVVVGSNWKVTEV